MKPQKKHILLIEDNPGDARLIREHLAGNVNENFLLDHVLTLEDAIERLGKTAYHLILLDLALPDSFGFDTFNTIHNRFPQFPVIVLTGNSDDELGSSIVRGGAQDFLNKGNIDETILQKSINYSIERFHSNILLEQTEKQYREIIEKNADGIVVTDEFGRVILMNSAAEKLLNLNASEFLGKPLDIDLNVEAISEIEVIDNDNNKIILQINVAEVDWEKKKAKIATLRNITELKSKQQRIEHLNKLLETISNINGLIVVEKDKSKMLSTACKLLTDGRSYSYVWVGLFNKNKSIKEIYHSGLNEEINELKEFIKSGKELYCLQNVLINDDVVNISEIQDMCGECPVSRVSTNNGSFALKISHKGITYGIMVLSHNNNTDYNGEEDGFLKEVSADLGLALHSIEVEENNRMSQEKLLWLNEALMNAANAVMLTDNEGVIEWINPAFSKLTGYSIQEAVGKKSNILKSGIQPPEFYTSMWNTLTSGRNWKGELINKKKDGTFYTEEMTISPVLNEHGKTEKYISIKSDITEKKRAQKAENKNKAVTETLFELSKMVEQPEDEIIDLALEKAVEFTESVGGYLHFMNDDGVSLKLFKWSKKVNEICTAQKIDHYPLEMAGIWADCVRLNRPVIHNDYKSRTDKKGLPEGHFELIRHISVPIYDGDRIVAVCGVGNKAYDYSDDDVVRLKLLMNEMWKLINRKKINQALQQNEQQFRSLFENATVGIYRTTPEGELLMANPRMIDMLNYNSFEEMKNSNQVSTGYVNPDDRTEFMEILFNEGVVYGFESAWKRKDGRTVYVRESARIIVDDENGEISFEGTVEDITEVKKTELELIEAKEKAEHSDKLKTQFLAQISHEIRTPVNTIVSFADLMKDTIEERGDDDELLLITNSLDSASQRLIRSIELILNMSELQLGSYEPNRMLFDLKKEILLQVIKEFESAAMMKNLEFKLISHTENPLVYADTYSVLKILQNLVDNAIKYTEEGFIQIEYSELDDRIMLEIKDSGIGISEEYQSKLFAAFSQEEQGYSRSYDGTGLGLALVKKYCDINMIDISVESVKGEGANFILLFPPVNK